ncbi:MAG: carbohydrate ABC transporter permease [Acutalibacter sp.]|nr:carbohydrate ABC transporter permease [Acutalibacter sp.]
MLKKLFRILRALFAFCLIFFALAPFCYVIFWSFFQNGGVFSLEYYLRVFVYQSQFLLRFWQSLGMCLCIAAGQLLVSVLAGYGFAKYPYRGSGVIFFLLMILMVMPVQVTLVPNYLLLGHIGLLNSYAGLVLPMVFAPLGAFILRQSFRSVPDAVLDAAKLDGCGVIKTLACVAMPMNINGLVCTALLSFLDAWNMVEQPITYLNHFENYPLSVALAYVPPADSGIQFACCVLVILPPLFLFNCFNKELVEGIVLAEVK